MVSEKMKPFMANNSAIRAMFEEGNRLAKIYGKENVFDFSLGNPNVPAPQAVKDAIIDILNEEDPVALHGYTNSNAGYEDVRQAVAESLNERCETAFSSKNLEIYSTAVQITTPEKNKRITECCSFSGKNNIRTPAIP